MNFSRNIFVEALCLFEKIPVPLFVSFAVIAIIQFTARLGTVEVILSGIVGLVTSCYLGYQVLATLLIPDRDRSFDLKNTAGFGFSLLILFFASFALLFIVALVIIFPLVAVGTATAKAALIATGIIFVTALGLTPFLITYLPASVVGYGQGIMPAIARGFRQLGYILSRSFVAVIAGFLLIVLVTLLFYPFAPRNLATSIALGKPADLSIWLITFTFTMSFIGSYIGLVSYVITARAFLLDDQTSEYIEEPVSQQRTSPSRSTRPMQSAPQLNRRRSGPAFGRR
ncbi:MAG: hypothetical protein ABJO30_06270 [Hyphomicrobiales bacterium]